MLKTWSLFYVQVSKWYFEIFDRENESPSRDHCFIFNEQFLDVIDVYEYAGEAGQSNFQINSADLPSNYIIPLDHINIRIGKVSNLIWEYSSTKKSKKLLKDCTGLDKDTTHVNDLLNAIFSFINWSNIQNIFFGEECHSYVLSMNIEPTNDFLNFPNWNSFVFEIDGLNVQSEARDPTVVNALQSECPDNCSSCPLVYSFQVEPVIFMWTLK